jgi:hypothetical protein
MKIITQARYGSTRISSEVRLFIRDQLEETYSSGDIERQHERLDNITDAFGRLVETLAERGQLTAPEVVSIAGGLFSSHAAFDLP